MRQACPKHPAKHSVKHPAVQVVRHVPMPPKRPLPAAGGFPHGALALRDAAASPAISLSAAARSGRRPAPRPARLAGGYHGGETSDRGFRKGKLADADAAENSISDPAPRKLAEWIILRSDNTKPSFERYAAFVTPIRAGRTRRCSAAAPRTRLWNDDVSDAMCSPFSTTISLAPPKAATYWRAFCSRKATARARSARALCLALRGLSADAESKVLAMFGGLLTRADHKARMDQRFYADDVEAGMRAANRLGGDDWRSAAPAPQ